MRVSATNKVVRIQVATALLDGCFKWSIELTKCMQDTLSGDRGGNRILENDCSESIVLVMVLPGVPHTHRLHDEQVTWCAATCSSSSIMRNVTGT